MILSKQGKKQLDPPLKESLFPQIPVLLYNHGIVPQSSPRDNLDRFSGIVEINIFHNPEHCCSFKVGVV
jgi:hypothetical protein